MLKSTETHTGSGTTSELTHDQKYRGLIKRSILKNFRDCLFRYFDYIYTMASSYHHLENIFRYVIILQNCVIALLPFNKLLWPADSLWCRVLSVFSVVAYICPTNASSLAHFIVVLIMYTFLLVINILFFSNLYVFLKMSKVHSFYVSVIIIFLNILQPYFINVISSNIGLDYYYILHDDYGGFHAINLTIGIIFLILFLFLQTYFVSPSLTFRPQIRHIMYSRFCLMHSISYVLIYALTTFGSLADTQTGSILIYVTILPCALICYISFRQHLWADIRSMYISQAFSVLYIIFSIILATLNLLKIKGNEIVIVVYIISAIVLFLVFQKLSEVQMKNYLILLNKVAEDESMVDVLSYEKIVGLLRYGFDNGHPLCHTWKLFDMALDKYNTDYGIVLMYARYAAIYSDESNALHIVIRLLKKMKHGSLELKHILFQVKSLLQHRERGLSKSLKKTLMKIQDKTEKCRNLMRYTWECVIRGNVVELENLSLQLKRNEEEILREYNQLCLVYPNNPYVTSSFSAFLLDIMGNEKEASEKQKIYRLLRSGAWTRTERSYYFAIRHIPTLLTDEQHSAMTHPEKSNVNDNQSYASSVAAIGMIGDLNDTQDELKAQKRYIESMVNSVKLPTSRYGPFLIFFSIAFMPVTIIPELIITYLRMGTNEESLNVIKYTSLINLYMSHIAFHTFQYVMNSLNFTSSILDKWNLIYNKDSIKYLFENKQPSFNLVEDKVALLDSVEYLRLLLNYFNNEIPNFSPTGFFDEPLNYIFNNRMHYRNYNDTNNYFIINSSLEYILTLTQESAIKVATKTNISSVLNTTVFWSIIKNAPEFFEQFDNFEITMIKSMQDMFDSGGKKTEIICSLSLTCIFILALLFVIFLTIKIEKEKKQLFTSFKAIPKSAVSAIVQQLNAQSGKDNTETDDATNNASAQEENALRVLSTSVDHGFGWIGRSWKIIVVILIFCIACVGAIVVMSVIPTLLTENIIELTPLFHDISTIHNRFMTILLLLNRIGQSYNDTDNPSYQYEYFPNEEYPDDYQENLDLASKILIKISDYAHVLRFGSSEMRSNGISSVGNSLIGLLTKRNNLNATVAEDDIIILEICSYDTSLEFANRLFTTMIVNLNENFGYYPISNDLIDLMIIWLLDTSYMNYVLPSFDVLDYEIHELFNLYRSSEFLIPLVLLVIVMVVCGIILVPMYQHISEIAIWTLKLLLFCDPNVILQSKAILKILSNDFSGDETDETEEKSSFYESIISHLFDGVLSIGNDLIVRSANNAVSAIIGKDPKDIVGYNLKFLFRSPAGQECSLRSFYQAVDGVMNCLRSPLIETEIEVMKNNEPATLYVSLMAISATGEIQTKPVNSEGLAILVLTLKDMTSTAVARNLLQEENAKNDSLLSMILPPIIVKKIQRGEHNISFTVTSASIVFVDIVAFTPWCKVNKASYVMSTLNSLNMNFDAALKKLDKMTKIKCIGDSYMCAGGIFDEVNQPTEHAKQAITFGLETIRIVKHLNEELHEAFRIRVGCNTGGPIIAGILGVDKPNFDILGPDINLALVMEQNGVPMQVHIPHSVYELVYGDYFVIKERGDIEVKDKIYHTYTVSGYAHHNRNH